MNKPALKFDTQDIVVDEVFPHAPETIWKALTTGELIARWLMPAEGFEAVVGNRFTYKTTPAGAWDGTIRCEILEVVPNQRLVYSWQGGHEDNVGYGSRLETVVSWTLARARKRYARARRPFRLRAAQERHGLPEHERRLEEGDPQSRCDGGGTGLVGKAALTVEQRISP